jgi:hypothetical protein
MMRRYRVAILLYLGAGSPFITSNYAMKAFAATRANLLRRIGLQP